MSKKNNNNQNRQLCEDARKIQDILTKRGYSIKKWMAGGNEKKPKYNLYLVPEGKNPWEGVYICPYNND